MAKGKSTWKYNKLLTARRNYYALGTNGFNNPTGLGIDFTSNAYHGYRGNSAATADFVKSANANGANIDPNNLPGSLGGGSVPATKSPNFLQQGFSTIGGMFKDPIGTLTGASPAGLGAASMISAGIGAIGGVAGNLLSNGMSSGAGNIVNGVGDALGSVPILGGLAKGALNIVGGGINALFGMKTNQAELNRVNSATASMADAANAASSAQSFDDSSLAGPNAVNFNVNAYKGGLFKKGKARRKNAALAAELRAASDFANRTAANSIENLQDEQLDNALGNFAAFGGELNTQGGNFTNGLLYIDNGGSHESNPYEGVPMGMDEQGIPNLVEEGEVVFNDYVFSNRLKVPKAIRKKYKLREGGPLTFADAVKKLSKESEERPNDPISMNGLEAIMSDFAIAQEELRAKRREKPNKFSKGGKVGRVYSGEEDNPYSQVLQLPQITKTVPVTDKGGNNGSGVKVSPTWLRYFPAFASGAMALTDAFGWTNKPDYSDAEAVLEASKNTGLYQPVEFRPVGNYLDYEPLDIQFAKNEMNAQSGATMRGISNISGGNRGAAVASMLAADNNFLNQLGNLTRQAREYNAAQRAKVEEFNRGTNEFNSEGFLKADISNQEARMKAGDMRLKGAMTAADMRQKERQASAAARSANLSNFINSIGDIGRENFSRNMILSDPSKYYTIDSNGEIKYKSSYYDLSESEQDYVTRYASRKSKKSRGGFLTIRRK